MMNWSKQRLAVGLLDMGPGINNMLYCTVSDDSESHGPYPMPSNSTLILLDDNKHLLASIPCLENAATIATQSVQILQLAHTRGPAAYLEDLTIDVRERVLLAYIGYQGNKSPSGSPACEIDVKSSGFLQHFPGHTMP
jgi:hypothetical protein